MMQEDKEIAPGKALAPQKGSEPAVSQAVTTVPTPRIVSSPISREKSGTMQNGNVSQVSPRPGISFMPGSKLEAKDFTDKWYSATVVETDWTEKEVLIHFDKWSSRYDEWIALDSPRLRALQSPAKENPKKVFVVGDRVSATWVDGKKYPATVHSVVEPDKYNVLFDDGYSKIMKSSKMTRIFQKPPSSAPVGPPQQYETSMQYSLGTKQERRDKKRKHLVSELFSSKKKAVPKPQDSSSSSAVDSPGPPKLDPADESQSDLSISCEQNQPLPPSLESNVVTPKPKSTKKSKKPVFDAPLWLEKFGEDEFSVYEEETVNGLRRSLKVQDKKLPEGWEKHIVQRKTGSSAGKWDVLFLHSATGKKFRSRNDIRSFMEARGESATFDPANFDFCVHPKNNKSRSRTDPDATTPGAVRRIKTMTPKTRPTTPLAVPLPPVESLSLEAGGEQAPYDANATFIGDVRVEIVDGYFRCPKDGCFKNFRKENLLQMHMKHYHPEYSKIVGSTPNVADLAYARTIGESFTDVIIPKRPKSCSTPLQQTHVPNMDLSANQSSLVLDSTRDNTSLLNDSRNEISDNNMSLDDSIDRSSSTMSPTTLFDRQNEDKVHTGIKTLAPLRPPTGAGQDLGSHELMNSNYEPPFKVRKMKYDHSFDHPQDFDGTTDENLSNQEDVTMDYSMTGNNSVRSEATAGDNSLPLPEHNENVKYEKLRKEEIINCVCNIMEEDGLMIQCDLCLCWQHGICHAIEKESDVPEKYICHTCLNPFRERPSRKYIHDQDWIKEGKLPVLNDWVGDMRVRVREAKLKRAFALVNDLLKIQEMLHSLRVKVNVAQNKNHPKLYLWAKSWSKPEIPILDPTPVPVMEIKRLIKEENEPEEESKPSDTELMKILEEDNGSVKKSPEKDLTPPKESPQVKKSLLSQLSDIKTLIEQPSPVVPQPEAPIDPLECKLRLLEHVDHSQNYIDSLLDFIENQVTALEEMDGDTPVAQIPDLESQVTWKQTIRMLLNDLETVRKMAALCPPQQL